MINWRVVPIESWPGEQARNRKQHPFRSSKEYSWGRGTSRDVDWSSTMRLLERELGQLRAKDVVLQMAVQERDVRNDGWIRANVESVLKQRDSFRAYYRDAAKRTHPDAGGTPRDFQLVEEAKRVLERHHEGAPMT